MDHAASTSHVVDPKTVTFFNDEEMLLKVAAASPPQALASALVKALLEGKQPIMRAIGHGAVGQAVKAQILARQMAAPHGLDLLFLPAFDNVKGEQGNELSAIVWRTLWR